MTEMNLSHIVESFPILEKSSDLYAALNYKPGAGDIFVATYPKCGTTWVGHILLLLFQEGKLLDFPPWTLHFRTPFLEFDGAKMMEKMLKPGVIKTHLPFHLIPWSEEAKYIYVTRNPKDCCVSFYHYSKNFPGYNFEGTFDEFYEMFVSGKTRYGDYFEHVLSWYPHRNDANVLFIAYEDLKENFDATILKMTSFLDDEKYAEPIRSNPTILENIKKHSSMEEMNKFMSERYFTLAEMSSEELKALEISEALKFEMGIQENKREMGKNKKTNKYRFVRKGIIGDWRSCFSEEQNLRLEKRIAKNFGDTDLARQWKKYI